MCTYMTSGTNIYTPASNYVKFLENSLRSTMSRKLAYINGTYFWGRKNCNTAINTKDFPHIPLPQKKKKYNIQTKKSFVFFS